MTPVERWADDLEAARIEPDAVPVGDRDRVQEELLRRYIERHPRDLALVSDAEQDASTTAQVIALGKKQRATRRSPR